MDVDITSEKCIDLVLDNTHARQTELQSGVIWQPDASDYVLQPDITDSPRQSVRPAATSKTSKAT